MVSIFICNHSQRSHESNGLRTPTPHHPVPSPPLPLAWGWGWEWGAEIEEENSYCHTAFITGDSSLGVRLGSLQPQTVDFWSQTALQKETSSLKDKWAISPALWSPLPHYLYRKKKEPT